MTQKFIIKISRDQSLEISPEVKVQLQPKSEYQMTFNKDEIIFKKISQFNSEKDSENLRDGSGISFLRHSGTWKGDDFE